MKLPLIFAAGVLLAGGTLASALGLEPTSGTSCVAGSEGARQGALSGAASGDRVAGLLPGWEVEALAGEAAPARPPAAPAAPAAPVGEYRILLRPVTGDSGYVESIFGLSAGPAAGVYELLGARQPRVRLDLQDVPAREALRRVFEQARVAYRLDADIPADVRVTVRADHIQLHTALDLITEAAGVGWSTEHRLAATLTLPRDLSKAEKEKRAAEEAVVTYRVGRTISTRSALARLYFQGRGGVVAPSLQLSQGLVPYAVFGREEHSTFTCPHCKQQSTMVRVRQQPKCPRCARVYQPDWQFCPADGARRPASPGEWRFCPACGKQVQPEKAEDPAGPEMGLPAPDRICEHEEPDAPVARMPGGPGARS